MRFELGSADAARLRGEPDVALAHLRAALRVDPENLRAQRQLGRALAALGQTASADGRSAEALELFRAALRSNPALASARNDVAWLLATAADPALRSPDEAVSLAETCEAAGRTASANELDTLAAAYAAAGRFDDAQRVARRALALAQPTLCRSCQESRSVCARYERGEPWSS